MKQYEISFKKNSVYQVRLVNAHSEEIATAYFQSIEPAADIVGSREHLGMIKPGMPVETVPEGWEPVEMIDPAELLEDIDIGDYGEYLNDYRDSSAYICDAIAEIADSHTSIYYSDILDFIRRNPEALADVVAEGLYEVRPGVEYDLMRHGQAAEYHVIGGEIYEHMRDSLLLCAVDFVRYDLKLSSIPAELGELIQEWADNADHNDRMDEIPDKIREYLAANDVEEV